MSDCSRALTICCSVLPGVATKMPEPPLAPESVARKAMAPVALMLGTVEEGSDLIVMPAPTSSPSRTTVSIGTAPVENARNTPALPSLPSARKVKVPPSLMEAPVTVRKVPPAGLASPDLHQGLDAPGEEEPVGGVRDAGTVADATVGRDAQQAQRGEYGPALGDAAGAR